MALRSLAGGTLFAESIGTVTPRVLALHGWGRRGSDFSNSLVAFGALAIDLPGFGASPPPDEVIGAREYAGIVAGALDQFDEPPVVVGHSFGGRVAVCLATQNPDRVGPLLITGAPLLRRPAVTKSPLGYRIARRLNHWGMIGDETIEGMKRKTGSADYRAARGVMRDILVKVVNEEYPEELAHQPQPVHLLWGENDREVPVSIAERSAELIVSGGGVASLEVIEGVGHHLPIQSPESLQSAVAEILS